MNTKIKWMAAMGYVLVIADAFSTQLLNFYQFYFFGYRINLVTITPLVIYYAINRSHPVPHVASHLKRSMVIYFWYIGWSIFSGVLFEANNLWVKIAGVGMTWLMLFVLVYIAISCGRGIIRAFRGEPAKAAAAKNARG